MEKNTYSVMRLVRFAKAAALGLAVFGMSYQSHAQMSGSYTIDKNSSASTTNFQSFTSAVQALRGLTRSDGGPSLGTGVNGAVVITVTPGSGPYTEQIIIPAITGASSTNTISFVGNGETIQHNSGSTNPAVIKLEGGDWIRLNDLHIKPLNTTYSFGVWLMSEADNNIIEDCDIDISASTYSGSAYSAGIAIIGVASSFTSYTTGGLKGRFNTIRGNYIHGNPSSYGMYAGIVMNGTSSYYDHGTLIEDNVINHFYVYGIYSYYYFGNTTFRGNTIVRGTKGTYTTFYGIYTYYAPGNDFYDNYISDGTPTNISVTNTSYGIYDYYGTTSYSSAVEYINNTVKFTNGYAMFGIYSLQYYAPGKKLNHNTIYFRSNQGYGYGLYSNMYDYSDQFIRNNIVDISFTSYVSTCYNMYIYAYGTQYVDGNVMPRTTTQSMHNTGYLYSVNMGGGQCPDWNAWKNNPNNPDQNGTDLRPTYVNVANNDMTPTLIDLDGMGVPAGVGFDQNGNARSVTNPDPGAIEFDIPINVSAINFPTAICQGATNDVEVTITNNSVLNLSNFWINYEINGSVIASEQYTGTINAGGSGNFTFSSVVVSDITGNFTLEAYVRGKAPVVSIPYSVNPAPVGSYVQAGSTFNGAFNSGDAQDPDIVAYGDQIQYSIMPPTGFTNGQYNSLWVFDSWELVTAGGTNAGAQHSKSNPSGSNNAVSSFTPVIGQSDSTFLLRYAIKSVTNGCVAPMIERTVFVAPRPVVDFVADPSCEGEGMQFDNNTTISSGSVEYLWDFGDGNTSVLINPNHAYAAAGTYDVELTATSNYGYSENITIQVTVYENPTAEFTHVNTCEGTVTPFTDASIIPAGTPTYEWDFGDGSAMGSGANPTHQYAATGVYEVTMKVTANGCSGEATNYVTYAPRAVPDFSTSFVDCNNDPVSFTNASTLSSGQMGYSWDFGDNTTSTSMNPTHQYTAFGTINITLTVTTDFGCVDMVSKQITLTEAPIADFNSSMLCDKDDADFLNLSSEPGNNAVTTYEWKFSDGASYTTKDVNRSFPSVGEYTVELKAISDNGCIDTEIRTISVDEEPSAQFYADDVCEGTDVAFRNASTGNMGNYTSAWDFGGGNTSTDKSPEVSLGVGTHTVTLTVTTPSGCESDVTKMVTVTANPVINSLDVSSGQLGDGTMSLIASVSPATVDYVIFWGDGGHETGSTTTGQVLGSYTYLIDGKYPVSLVVNNGECLSSGSSSASVLRTGVLNLNGTDLKVYPNPNNGRFNLDLSGLNGGVVSISVTSANGQSVNGNTVINGSTAQLDLSGVASGVYLVTVTTDSGVYTTRVTVNN